MKGTIRVMQNASVVFRKELDSVGIEQIEIDRPLRHEVLVRTVASGVCHSDLHVANGTSRYAMDRPIWPWVRTPSYVSPATSWTTCAAPGTHGPTRASPSVPARSGSASADSAHESAHPPTRPNPPAPAPAARKARRTARNPGDRPTTRANRPPANTKSDNRSLNRKLSAPARKFVGGDVLTCSSRLGRAIACWRPKAWWRWGG